MKSVFILSLILRNLFPPCSVPTEQPPARSWISLQEPDRTWPSGKDFKMGGGGKTLKMYPVSVFKIIKDPNLVLCE